MSLVSSSINGVEMLRVRCFLIGNVWFQFSNRYNCLFESMFVLVLQSKTFILLS